MAFFAVRRARGPAWDGARAMTEQDEWPAHAAFMNGLAEARHIVLGGPVGDGAETLLIFEAAAEREIHDRLAADPWVPMGLLVIASVEPWQILLDRQASVQPPS
jgi:uncharacterized protein YciI